MLPVLICIFFMIVTLLEQASKVSTEEAGAARCVKLLTNTGVFLFNLGEDYAHNTSVDYN